MKTEGSSNAQLSKKAKQGDGEGLQSDKRSRMGALGFAAAALIGSTAMYPTMASAQPRPLGPDPLPGPGLPGGPGGPAVPGGLRPGLPGTVNRFEQLRQLNVEQLRQLTITSRLPMSTPITRMGLDQAAINKLTPAARSLTKEDLEVLGKGQATGRLSTLTVQDINSIRGAFRGGYNPSVAGVDVSCCCCTPCCCAAAVSAPASSAA